jgi:regulation of enolase protein 1 (concanavalin A-like superfamily)
MKNLIYWFTSLLLLICALSSIAQTGSLKIKTIPYPLYWENTPLSFSANDNNIVITAGAKTDMFRDPNVTYNTDNAPKLLFDAADDFILSASVEHAFNSKWDGGAIVIKQDSLNWIKFCFEKDYTGARRVVSVVTKGVSDDCNSIELQSNKVYYKVAKAGNVITLYYSTDNKKWFLIRHLQFDATKKLKLGFLAQSPTGDKCEVKFSDIQYSEVKIKDPYLGE